MKIEKQWLSIQTLRNINRFFEMIYIFLFRLWRLNKEDVITAIFWYSFHSAIVPQHEYSRLLSTRNQYLFGNVDLFQ